MKTLFLTICITLFLPTLLNAQKGIDTQTKTIKDEAKGVTSRSTDATRSFDWGAGKTQVRERLDNPYKLTARRDVLVENIVSLLKEKKIAVDEASSRLGDGVIITQPFVFAKGPVTTQNELRRYGILEFADNAWSRAQYTLTIEVQSIDGIQNNVSVNAKVEGRSGNGLGSEWVTVRSSGLAEDDFLVKLVESITGNTLDAPVKTDQ
ncbi:MAG: hypothetical protein H7070_05490 [Saprospiraceae bacterium]|nr:hypothetical protein [Pyrinomonadaceae bacterium]